MTDKVDITDMTLENGTEIARSAIERHLGDVATLDSMYDEAFTLGLDALLDAGYPHQLASHIASEQAQLLAQP